VRLEQNLIDILTLERLAQITFHPWTSEDQPESSKFLDAETIRNSMAVLYDDKINKRFGRFH
jgi:hypothetical protein